jgi:hypothetical protein
MVLLDVGLAAGMAECRACGYREPWDATDHAPAGGDD